MENKISDWEFAVEKLEEICPFVPQAVFVGLQISLQHEWVYLQRVTDLQGNTDGFRSLENKLADVFLPGIFGFTPPDRSITKLPFKTCGISIPNPTESAVKTTNSQRNQRL